ncbi:hypothetical protein GCM10011352_04650 [Marinobacterium zhoushanense]|uniref:Uncharacterized protein n=2 Tax=Marinobacterium zhoushanense TaxID=1679163 RepID=A0ABQ1JY96_9GAMM|nr:hypothetical protein GCM10011352_04650 [Marinobacterium zhoushanense]
MTGAIWVYGALKDPTNERHSQDLAKIRLYLNRVMREEDLRNNFADYLRRSLRISKEEEVNNILWSIPRGVFSEFLPSIERELDTDFVAEGGVSNTALYRSSPAPEYITGQLFGALNVPDIAIIPPSESGAISKNETMDFFQALKEFAPGRISKRYAKWGKDSWVILPTDFELDPSFAQSEREFVISRVKGDFSDQLVLDNRIQLGSESLPIARPLNLRPSTTKKFNHLSITDRSHSMYQWEVYLENRQKQVEEEILILGDNEKVGVRYTSSLHRHGEQRQITRFSRSAEATFTTTKRESLAVKFSFVGTDGNPLALGCTNYYDMMEFYFDLPNTFAFSTLGDDHKRSLRLSLFVDLLKEEISQSKLFINNFDTDWIRDCFLGFVLSSSLEYSSFEAFRRSLVGKKVPDDLLDTPERMFARDESVDEEDEASEKLYKHLKDLLANQTVFDILVRAFNAAFEDTNAETERVFQALVERTLAGLINSLALRVLPDLAENLILSEVLPRKEGEPLCVLMSESDPGGCGYLERLRYLLVRETGKATDILVSCAKPTDNEFVLSSIEALLSNEINSSSGGLLERFRAANTVTEEQEISRGIKRKLLDLGRYPSQTLMNVLYTKLLRAGSSSETDKRTLELIGQWRAINKKQGVEWPLSVFAYAVATRQGSSNDDIQAIKSEVQDLLYPHGGEVRCNALNFYNRFVGVVSTDRVIAEALLHSVSRVEVIDGFDLEAALAALKNKGAVEIIFSPAEQQKLEILVSELLVCTVEHKGLLFAPKLSGVRYSERGIAIKFELPEVL